MASPLVDRCRYTRFNLSVNQKLWQKLENTQADEKAFQFATEGSQRGGSRLWALRKNFTNDEWDTVAATVIDQLGKAPAHLRGAAELGGAAHDFSASTFLTNWNKLSPEAKMALFSRRYTDMRRSLDNLVKAMDAAKNTQRMSNPSGTARQLLTVGQGAAAATAAFTGNIPTAVAILAGPWISGRMMTSPTFIRLLTGFAKTADKGPLAIQRFATNLGFAASAEPDIREEVLQLQRPLVAQNAEARRVRNSHPPSHRRKPHARPKAHRSGSAAHAACCCVAQRKHREHRPKKPGHCWPGCIDHPNVICLPPVYLSEWCRNCCKSGCRY